MWESFDQQCLHIPDLTARFASRYVVYRMEFVVTIPDADS